ncbi:MAG TPA: F0F1 ATP synthase subunit gamma [Azoarcus sp.]|nr:F0F1 ATP synthase subunit gamma [Azoarcus sp.]
MASGKEIRTKIKSVQNTRKITKAMEMVAASKMRKAQERMRQARPYADKIRQLAANLSQANVADYRHPFVVRKPEGKKIGLILVTSDKGLCGGLNTNIQRIVINAMRQWESEGASEIRVCCIGNKGLGFMTRIGATVVSQATQLGDTPRLETIIGPMKVVIDAFQQEELDTVYLGYNRFVNAMKQEPVLEQLLPVTGEQLGTPDASWDYVYEPTPEAVIDELMLRYVETLVYQALIENMACEQSARMVAMKAASDNAKDVIGELQLVYNKTRQAAITKELAEIVGGAAAV